MVLEVRRLFESRRNVGNSRIANRRFRGIQIFSLVGWVMSYGYHGYHSKFAASKKKRQDFLLSKVRFPTFVVRRRNRPAGEGNFGNHGDKPIFCISPPSYVASSDRMITASSLIRV